MCGCLLGCSMDCQSAKTADWLTTWVSTGREVCMCYYLEFEMMSLPQRVKWVFDLQPFAKGPKAKRHRLRRGAVTAA